MNSRDRGVGRELAIAELVAVADAPIEELGEIVDACERHAPFHLAPRRQAQRYARDRAEQAIAADRKREQFGIVRAAAVTSAPVGSTRSNDSTSAIIGRSRRPRPWMFDDSAPPIVSRSAPVCFWMIPHCRSLPCAGPQQVIDQTRPVDARLDGHEAALGIEFDDPVERRHVQQHGRRAELLSAHRVTAARRC